MYYRDIIRRMGKKKNNNKNNGLVIIPTDHPNPPEQHEVDAAYVLARHYQTIVEFLVPVDDYKRKSADILMQNVVWEIKSPNGSSKSTIRNQFRRASKVHELANCRKGVWRSALMLNSVLTNKEMASLGFITMTDHYLKVCVN